MNIFNSPHSPYGHPLPQGERGNLFLTLTCFPFWSYGRRIVHIFAKKVFRSPLGRGDVFLTLNYFSSFTYRKKIAHMLAKKLSLSPLAGGDGFLTLNFFSFSTYRKKMAHMLAKKVSPSPLAGEGARRAGEGNKKHIFIFFLFLLFSPIIFAAPAQNIYNFNTVGQQNRFDDLTQNLRCLVCQNQTLAESNAPLAQDLRRQIYQMIQTQKSNQQIKDYLIHRYGNFVSYTPPLIPSTYLLWGLPGILLLMGIFIIRRLSS